MQLTTETTITYVHDEQPPVPLSEEATETTEPKEWWQNLPMLFWATVVLFTVNLVIGLSVLLSPGLTVDAYGEELTDSEIRHEWRPSPYTQVADTVKRRVREPERIYPAAFVVAAPSEDAYKSSLELDIPRVTASATNASRPGNLGQHEISSVRLVSIFR